MNFCGPKRVLLSMAIVAACLLNACASGRFGPSADTPSPEAPRRLSRLTVTERQALLRRAKVWHPVRTETLNLLAGPPQPAASRIAANLTCAYVFPHKPLGGNTPKFDCGIKPSDVVKVKYGAENGEVYGEVAASRLFWALGFQADAMYPARVTCTGCPEDPFRASTRDWPLGRPGNLRTMVFEAAAVERKILGSEIEVPGVEGWAWPELDVVNETAGGASRAQVDALKLSAFVQPLGFEARSTGADVRELDRQRPVGQRDLRLAVARGERPRNNLWQGDAPQRQQDDAGRLGRRSRLEARPRVRR